MLKALGLLAILAAGWGLGRMRPHLNLPILALTLFAAVSAHSAFQSAFVDGRLDVALGDPRDGANAGVIVLIAAGEAIGLWLPFLLLPWAPFGARPWAALYVLAAVTLAGVVHYFPFDLVIIDRTLIAPDGPPYLFAALACLPAGGVGYLIGWLKSHNERDEL